MVFHHREKTDHGKFHLKLNILVQDHDYQLEWWRSIDDDEDGNLHPHWWGIHDEDESSSSSIFYCWATWFRQCQVNCTGNLI